MCPPFVYPPRHPGWTCVHAFSPNGNICPLVLVASVLKNEVIWAPDRSSIRGLNSSRGGSGDGVGGSAEEGEGEKLRASFGFLCGYTSVFPRPGLLGEAFRPLGRVPSGLQPPNCQSLPCQGQANLMMLMMTRAGSCNGKILVPSPQ